MKKIPMLVFIFSLLLIPLFAPKVTFAANSYYVSLSGSDTNSGTEALPFKTFSRAFKSLKSGDTLNIFAGTYTERLDVKSSGASGMPITIQPVTGQKVVLDGGGTKDSPLLIGSGISYVTVKGLSVTRSPFECVLVRGSNVKLENLDVYECKKFGYRLAGSTISVSSSKCHDAVTENRGGKNTSGGWGACMRTTPGSSNMTINNNEIYNNWGEGLIIGQAINVKVYDNKVYDNFSQNIYIGNTHDVEVYRNFTYSTNPTYYRAGSPANCISSSEETINNTWGAQLGNIKVYNNIAYGCKIGVGYTYKEVSGNGCNNCLFANNTLVNTGGIKIIDGPKNHVVISNNIVNGGKIIFPSGNDIKSQNNLVGDPVFATKPNTNQDSFKLAFTSKAIDKGIAVSGVTDDFYKNSRDKMPDIGAVEYGSSMVKGWSGSSIKEKALNFFHKIVR